jgi:hypothetical protein
MSTIASGRILMVGSIGLVMTLFSTHANAAEANKACGLATPAEIESALGSSVVLNPMGGGKAEFCTGQAPNAKVVLRLASGLDPGRDRSGAKEKAGLEMMKKMGVQIEVKIVGPIVCSTVVPPAGKEQQMGYNTTCTVSKDTAVAGIEVTAKSQKDMVSIERLHPLAEKMAGRF